MKTIEEKYREHKIPEDLKEKMQDPYILVLNVDDVMKRLQSEERYTARRKKKNHLAQKIFRSEEELLKAEEDCYNSMLEIIDGYQDMLIGILEVLTEENFQEMVKLIDFMIVEYLNNKGNIAGRIEALNQSVAGFSYADYRYQYTYPELKEFVLKKIEEEKQKKQLVKN